MIRIPTWALGAAALLSAASTGAGCDKACSEQAYSSSVRLTLHLPAESDVATPETVKVCQEERCALAVLPTVSEDQKYGSFEFDLEPTPPFTAPSTVTLGAGGVRRLDINWPIVAGTFNPKSPGNLYDVQVTDANNAETGHLLVSIDYEHHVDQACGVDFWTGEASD
jgi:hypothetical protein